MLSVEEGGSVVTIAPIWRAGDETKTVTVKATNNLDETSLSSTFELDGQVGHSAGCEHESGCASRSCCGLQAGYGR